MVRRTTVEIDEELLSRAKRALGQRTIRATVEEALRRATHSAEADHAERAALQQQFLDRFSARVDVKVLASGEMWE